MTSALQNIEPREVLAGGMIKGGMMAAHVTWATRDRLPDYVARFWGAVPPNVADKVRGLILPIKWYEFADLIAIDRAIVKVYGGGDIAILRDIGAMSASLNLSGVYKVYQRDSIHDFLTNSAKLHSKFQDFGEAAYRRTGDCSGQMSLSKYISYSPLYCESAIGFYRQALEIHSARDVSVAEIRCQCLDSESCTYEISWR